MQNTENPMASFTALVHERTSTNPADLYAKGAPVSAENPFGSAKPEPKPAAATPASQNAPGSSAPKTYPKKTYTNNKASQKREEEFAATKALKEKVDIIQLSLVMQMLGAQGNQDNDKGKWKIPGVGNITVTGQAWYNLETEEGSRGAVGLVMHAKSMKYPLAVQWLGAQFGESVDSDDIKAAADSGKRADKTFSPPAKSDRHIAKVKHYLKFNRKIPEDIIDDLISQGRIYADEEATCVFASDGIAELRSSFDGPAAVKKLVTGSTRKKGFLALPDPKLNERTLAICESAIDVMSYRALYPGRAAISSAGANQAFPRAIAEEAIEQGFKVVAAFDADKAGDRASQALFNHFYLKLWLKHKAQAEIGRELDDDELFQILDTKTVASHLVIRPAPGEAVDSADAEFDNADGASDGEEEDPRNIFFFNKNTPFDDPLGPPTILVNIKKNDFGLPACSKFPIEVTRRGYDFILAKIGLARDRPKGEKDWNEMLKKRPEPSKAIHPTP